MRVVEESVVIAPDVLAAVAAHAHACAPNEACGLLVGERNGATTTVARFAPIPNVSKTPQRNFVLDPATMLAVEDAAEAARLSVVGVMHSHPTSPAVPSPTDRRDAERYDPTHSFVHVLVSLTDEASDGDPSEASTQPTVAAWRLGPGEPRRIRLEAPTGGAMVAPMDYTRYLEIIETESHALRAAAEAAGLQAAVPPCPGWEVSDLVDHIAGVQQWAAQTVSTREAKPRIPLERDAATLERFSACTAELLDVLRNANPDDVCAGIAGAPPSSVAAPDHTVAFWARRQADEVVIHRADAELAAGIHPTIEADVAVDVIDEYISEGLARFVARDGVDLASLKGDVHVHCTDADGEWTFEYADGAVTIANEHRKAAAAVRGPASDVALYLFSRTIAPTVEVFGDTELVQRWREIGSI